MSQVDKLEDLNEKNILAEMINLANAYNLYFFSESNSLRLDRLEKSGLFDSIKNPNQLMRLFPAMTVAGYIVTQVVAFVVGYLTSYVISNIFGCTSEDTLCTILHGVMWGVYFALGAHFGMCQEELLPWQWQSGNVRLGCFGNILALNKVEKVPFQIQILSC